MSIIYTPKGKAREYSPYACNVYTGCNHGCKYCYAPAIRRRTREEYLNIIPRRNLLRDFEKDCAKMENLQSQVLFCFMTDPYNSEENNQFLTKDCIELALKYKIPCSILTKSKLVLRDIDLFKKFGDNIAVGVTLTFDNEIDSVKWEPRASTPEERINILKELKMNNINTWASFEPVIIPGQSLSIMQKSIEFVNLVKVGKLNNYGGIDKRINWNDFLIKSCELLRKNKINFYVKQDLRKYAEGFKLYGNEINMDEFILSWVD